MSGPNPPGRGPDEPDYAGDSSAELEPLSDTGNEPDAGGNEGDLEPLGDSSHVPDLGSHLEPTDQTSDTDEAYSRAYSALESEQFVSGSYIPAELSLYDYDGYDDSSDLDEEQSAPRWPWVVGIAAILAAVALVTSVSLLVTRTDPKSLANPGTTSSAPPVQDEITTTKPPPPPPPPPPTSEIPTATETQTVTVTPPPPPPPPETTAPPPPVSTSATPPAAVPPPTTTTTLAGPRQVTYSVTGTKAPGDIISVTYVDASGRRRTQHNVYIPWSMTVTPISQSDVGSVEASSLFRVSRLNCSITTSDGTVLSSNSNDAPQTSC
ncbi:Mycobacterium membrane protein [Mycobacterium basiliense]|uniref:Probable transport accessory protein MmpS3 n=9 Tax=Bacteria TaxID=2 RepID=A0A447GFX8_9MYCO|nr:MmpS family transport accessory protein [Mycobacterium basiliense]VDM89373.1 Mycobacterium membrane protein [Mycobacterium basiliense]